MGIVTGSCATGENLMSFDGQRLGSNKGSAEVRYDGLHVHITTWMDSESRVERDTATRT